MKNKDLKMRIMWDLEDKQVTVYINLSLMISVVRLFTVCPISFSTQKVQVSSGDRPEVQQEGKEIPSPSVSWANEIKESVMALFLLAHLHIDGARKLHRVVIMEPHCLWWLLFI